VRFIFQNARQRSNLKICLYNGSETVGAGKWDFCRQCDPGLAALLSAVKSKLGELCAWRHKIVLACKLAQYSFFILP
jgi:hypothetical protein